MNTTEDIITPDTANVSEPFSIPVGGQIQLHASGLQGDDRVLIEVVGLTRSGPLPTECCPGPVSLPEVNAARVLRCRNGARVILTAEYPYVTLDTPQGVKLRARLEADDLSVVTVALQHVEATGCDTCQCVEPYCPSYPLTPRGYAFAASDAKDPEATVLYVSGLDAVYLFPTARRGATVPIRTGLAVVGYAANESECAGPAPQTVLNVTSAPSQVVSVAVDEHGQITLTQTGGPNVVSNNPNPC